VYSKINHTRFSFYENTYVRMNTLKTPSVKHIYTGLKFKTVNFHTAMYSYKNKARCSASNAYKNKILLTMNERNLTSYPVNLFAAYRWRCDIIVDRIIYILNLLDSCYMFRLKTSTTYLLTS